MRTREIILTVGENDLKFKVDTTEYNRYLDEMGMTDKGCAGGKLSPPHPESTRSSGRCSMRRVTTA
ncbi:MAG: hypothetical protein L6W00_27045 [Lentisphaeria bacterium]|nr:MAG: hypothetical protein L6W00_27045 [Lentisphaeria bacterium]